jgi:methylmalonyl-CoA mutase C-terminal domain/subunit
MAQRKTRILLGKLGEGYRDTLFQLAEAFREAGFEVVFTDLQDPEAIVRSAVQESVDHIGITILPEADIQAFSEIRDILKREGIEDITVTAGGFLDEKDVPALKALGVLEFFPRGTSWETLIEWSKKHIERKDH